MKKERFTQLIKAFDFKDLFNEMGWDNFSSQIPVMVKDKIYQLKGVVEKKSFVILQCLPDENGKIPAADIRKQIEHRITKTYFEHLLIFADQDKTQQIWQLAVKEENKPKQVREVTWYSHQDTEALFERMKNLLFTLDEEETITIIDVKSRISENFGKNNDKVTKKFYTDFKKQHTQFLGFIKGIEDTIPNKNNKNKQWYASLMLNRLMFCYFIQRKGFLNQDIHYLSNKLNECRQLKGKANFYSFYRSFLLELFHNNLGKSPQKRPKTSPVEMGKIPYLNGGLFDVHQLELQFQNIQIDDEAFRQIFDFFDQWNWHLDNRMEASGRDINPDVIGYIFEKYINDRAAMGAYYTKEDITEYIGKNTIIPYLFDETERHYKQGFKPDGELWAFLQNSSTAYIYDAVKHGVPEDTADLFADLPDEVKAGIHHPLEEALVAENTRPHLWEIRKPWNEKAPETIGLPTEIYRELIERRQRFADLKEKIERGEIRQINDLITYNLNIRQFVQDFLESATDADFIRHFYKALSGITILDPTCGSGAFLFAGLNILEPLYEACINRMEQFVAEEPEKHLFFEETLEKVNDPKHSNLKYFIYKSIILNNLYGVDIMHEAVEIAKLRLFLKMVATVEANPRKDNYGLEPLPDIDFNIRAGNTLIGYATEKDLADSVYQSDPLFGEEKLKELKEEIALVSQAFSRFQNSQLINDQGSDSFKLAKAQLNQQLAVLNHQLNLYLSSQYGISDVVKQKAQYEDWLATHQPFHWFAEFYRIIGGNGGFDCIIGNPPYVETKKINYSLKNYQTFNCGNLYTHVVERCYSFLQKGGKFSMIIPHSAICTDRMSLIISILKRKKTWYSTWDIRPSKLFDGVDQRLLIFISSLSESGLISSAYHRWGYTFRPFVFENLRYAEQHDNEQVPNSVAKVEFEKEIDILEKLNSNINLGQQQKTSSCFVYFHNAPRYFIRVMNEVPYFWNEKEGVRNSTQVKSISFGENKDTDVVGSLLNSSLFYWFFILFSDCRHLNKREIDFFKFSINSVKDGNREKLNDLFICLNDDYNSNKIRKTVEYKATGKVIYDEYYPKKSKPIIDQIDTVLAEHYEFTESELDFIINYDIKYRMGDALNEEEGEEEE